MVADWVALKVVAMVEEKADKLVKMTVAERVAQTVVLTEMIMVVKLALN